MPRLALHPKPATRLRGTEVSSTGTSTGLDRGTAKGDLRTDARRVLTRAASGLRLRGTALKTRLDRS